MVPEAVISALQKWYKNRGTPPPFYYNFDPSPCSRTRPSPKTRFILRYRPIGLVQWRNKIPRRCNTARARQQGSYYGKSVDFVVRATFLSSPLSLFPESACQAASYFASCTAGVGSQSLQPILRTRVSKWVIIVIVSPFPLSGAPKCVPSCILFCFMHCRSLARF